MPTRIAKSRTFAVVIDFRGQFGVYFLWTRKDLDAGTESLEHQAQHIKWADASQKDNIIELLKKAGLTVRFFEPDERQWMDTSLTYGLVAAPGSRDGQWAFPTLDQFKEDFLGTV